MTNPNECQTCTRVNYIGERCSFCEAWLCVDCPVCVCAWDDHTPASVLKARLDTKDTALGRRQLELCQVIASELVALRSDLGPSGKWAWTRRVESLSEALDDAVTDRFEEWLGPVRTAVQTVEKP